METLTGRKASRTALRRLAVRQFGVLSSHQAEAVGVDPQTLRRMSMAGDIARVLPRTYRFEGTPWSEYQELSIACRWAGERAALSHDTAGWLLGLTDHKPSSIHITRPGTTKSPKPGIVVHRTELPAKDVSSIRGLAVTTMPRTLIDMAAVCTEEITDNALDAAIRQGMSRAQFLRRTDELARPGRTGSQPSRGSSPSGLPSRA